MNATPYDRYQHRLQQVSTEQWKTRIIAFLAADWPEWDASRPWVLCYGRFDPDRQRTAYLTLLLQQADCSRHLCLLEISTREPDLEPGTQLMHNEQMGWIKARRFPDDPRLSQLNRVLSDPANNIDVLRYRPYKRCTFRCQPNHDEIAVFGKMFADQRGKRIHDESQALWQAAANGQLNFQVARPIQWDAATQTLWQHSVEGQPLVEQLFSKEGSNIARRIGQAAASLPASSLKPGLRFDGFAQLQRSGKYANELAQRLPELADSVTDLLHSLRQIHARQGQNTRLRAIHGAPHAHQWLDCGEQLGLVDFDRICLGDPELDAATFIGEMDFEDHASVPVDELNAVFLDAYQSIAGKLDARLLQAYRSHKRLAKALKAARSIRTTGVLKARRHLAFAHQALRESVA